MEPDVSASVAALDAANSAGALDAANAGAMGGVMLAVWGLVMLAMVASMWRTFTKAGKPGWASIVPIYNLVVLTEIAGKPTWWVVLFFLPVANIVALFGICMGVAKNFGKSAGFGIGLALFGVLFFPMLAFGSAQYQGTQGHSSTGHMPRKAA